MSCRSLPFALAYLLPERLEAEEVSIPGVELHPISFELAKRTHHVAPFLPGLLQRSPGSLLSVLLSRLSGLGPLPTLGRSRVLALRVWLCWKSVWVVV